jgi:hypothetical protein
MQTNGDDLGSPVDWLRRGKSNLIRARQPKPKEVYWEDLCFESVLAWVEKQILPDTTKIKDLPATEP